MKIYRNTFDFIFFASFTIDAFEKKNAKNPHFCAACTGFTLNSNEHCFFIYVCDGKIIKRQGDRWEMRKEMRSHLPSLPTWEKRRNFFNFSFHMRERKEFFSTFLKRKEILFSFFFLTITLSKEFKFFWPFDLEWSNDNDDKKALKCYNSTLFKFFFKNESCSFRIFFQCYE